MKYCKRWPVMAQLDASSKAMRRRHGSVYEVAMPRWRRHAAEIARCHSVPQWCLNWWLSLLCVCSLQTCARLGKGACWKNPPLTIVVSSSVWCGMSYGARQRERFTRWLWLLLLASSHSLCLKPAWSHAIHPAILVSFPVIGDFLLVSVN